MRCYKWTIALTGLLACSNQQPAQTHDATPASDTTIAQQQVKDSFSSGNIMTHIGCKSDSTQSYALYIPVAQSGALMPVIYCFDPHGDGTLPLKNY